MTNPDKRPGPHEKQAQKDLEDIQNFIRNYPPLKPAIALNLNNIRQEDDLRPMYEIVPGGRKVIPFIRRRLKEI